MPASSLNLRRTRRRPAAPASDQPTEARIARIDALTAAGRTNWFGLMAYLVFAFITVLGVSDADFFIPARQTQLPLVNVEIPTKSFFYFAPILAVALYAYLHLHIRKVTAALAAADATVEGTPLERHIKPWLLNDLVLRWRRDGAIDPMPMDWLATVTAVLLIWAAGPFVLAAIWVRSWPAHDEWMTTIAGLCLALSLYAGHVSWLRMTRAIPPRSPRRALLREARHVVATALTVVAIPLVLVLGAVKTEFGAVPDPNDRPWQNLRSQLSEDWRTLWDDDGPRRAGLWPLAKETTLGAWEIVTSPDWATHLESARLAEVQFSALPPDQSDPSAAKDRYRAEWCERTDPDSPACGGPREIGADALDARDLWCVQRNFFGTTCEERFVNQAFDREWWEYRAALIRAVEKPELRATDLRGADLRRASLTGLLLTRARLDNADLSEANLERAELSEARMEGAILSRSRMEGAYLGYAHLEGAIFEGARMEEAYLGWAMMNGANLRGANLDGAILRSARMNGASLPGAQMQGADLWETQLNEAYLVSSQMEGTDLRNAQMRDASVGGANLQNADLSSSELQGASFWGAQMQASIFWAAQMEGTNLGAASLEGADFWKADLAGANFFRAQLAGANLGESNLNGAQMKLADLGYSRVMGTARTSTILRSAELSGAENEGGAFRFADLTEAMNFNIFAFRNAFGDATVLLPIPDVERPCHWPHRELRDEEFFAHWRGWLALAPDAPSWDDIAPEEWHDVEPVPPPPGCVWHD